ncbi:hypothetical protein ABH931_006692 [Streptacidiphilus sp. MAP12-33]|uniref:hypothetical protein n=1 Tax=Streptacidiphilus sp. MAP12-33 TaxID=3156266 RepID=UPI003515D571
MSSDNEQQPVRTAGRHAAPRPTVRGRMQRPVGRAIALTAMPTALLMGMLAPKLAFAADGAAKVAPKSAPDLAGTTGGTCTKGAPGTGTGATTPATPGTTTTKSGVVVGKAAPHTTGTGASVPAQRGGTGGSTSGGTGSASGGSAAGGSASGGSASGGSASGGSGSGSTGGGTGGTGTGSTPTPTPSPTQGGPSDPLGGILGGLLGGLLGGHTASGTTVATTPTAQPSGSASASAKPQAHAAAVRSAATPAPSTSAAPTSAKPSATATPPATPSTSPSSGTGGTGATPSPTATPTSDPNKPCDISHLAAPLDTSVSSQLAAGTMPVEKWTLKSSDLKLINTEFHGVVTVPLADGSTQRVLKFTAEAVNIGDLDMSANQRGQEVHVQGSPGSTSTMRGGTVTMYVTELKGTLLAAEGIPLSLLNVSLDLTPDTLPQWLYNLIGAIPIPLTLEMGNVTAIQQGQFGGNLTIPGMHLFYTPLGQ